MNPFSEAAEPLFTPTNSGTSNLWISAAIVLLGALFLALLVHFAIFLVLPRILRVLKEENRTRIVQALKRPSRLLLPLLAVQLALPAMQLGERPYAVLHHALSIGMILAVVWVVLGVMTVAEVVLLRKYDLTAPDNRLARKVHTQVKVTRRTLAVVVGVIGVAAVLMTFPRVQQLGASILASAGIAGLVVGLAARPMVENLLAGLQIAFTEPFRLDDAVIMEGEFGRIEEITTTFVVVRVWDGRRIIVPFSKLLGNSFQNWTRTSNELLGTVFLYTDYSVDVEALRREFIRVTKESPLWNGKAAGLIVNEAKPDVLELRGLVSADDSGKTFDLRAFVREKMIEFLQREYPDSLPKVRAEIHSAPPAGEPLGTMSA